MAFGKSSAILAHNQRNMIKVWCCKLEGLIKKKLPWCGWDEIISTNHLIDTLCGIIHHDGKLIGWNALPRGVTHAPDDKVPGLFTEFPWNEAMESILKVGFPMWQPEPPTERFTLKVYGIGYLPVGAGARVNRFFTIFVGGTGGLKDLASGAGAWVDKFPLLQFFQSLLV